MWRYFSDRWGDTTYPLQITFQCVHNCFFVDEDRSRDPDFLTCDWPSWITWPERSPLIGPNCQSTAGNFSRSSTNGGKERVVKKRRQISHNEWNILTANKDKIQIIYAVLDILEIYSSWRHISDIYYRGIYNYGSNNLMLMITNEAIDVIICTPTVLASCIPGEIGRFTLKWLFAFSFPGTWLKFVYSRSNSVIRSYFSH